MMGILLEPVIIRQFWRERGGGAARIQLRKYEGRGRLSASMSIMTLKLPI
jgi:hypothetical protein